MGKSKSAEEAAGRSRRRSEHVNVKRCADYAGHEHRRCSSVSDAPHAEQAGELVLSLLKILVDVQQQSARRRKRRDRSLLGSHF